MKYKKAQISRLPGLFLLLIALFQFSSGLAIADDSAARDVPSNPQGVYPSQVTLDSFSAETDSGDIVVAWSTEIEQFNSGFNLCRAVHGTHQFVRLNAGLIPSQVQAGPGQAAYRFTDTAVVAGTIYDYRLESVDFQALPTYHGQVTVEATVIQPPQMNHRVFLPFVVNH